MSAPAPAPAASPTPTRRWSDRRMLNVVLAIGIVDALLLLVLLYVSQVDRSDAAISVLGPIHGLGYVILLLLTAKGAGDERWGWWFPAIVLITGGPIGTIVGDVILRRRLPGAPDRAAT